MEADALLAQEGAEPGQAGRLHGGGAAELPGQREGQAAVPEVVEAGGVAGQRRFEVFADLAAERRAPGAPECGDGG